MALTTILIIVIPGIILLVFLNLASRELFLKFHEMKRRSEREQALAESLRLDFTRESKTLKRVAVEDPVARILCVDDEEVVLDSLRKILVLDGYSIDTVETGQEALGLVQSNDYDFVFTDLKMPSMSGTDVAKSVKHLRPDVDVVIITGYATVESAVECMRHGAMDYIEKPFTEDELRDFVRRAVIRREDRIRQQLSPRVHVLDPSEPRRPVADEFTIPGGALISGGHCWARLDEDGTVRIGVDDFARKLTGRVDSIEFPDVGRKVAAGQFLFSVGQKHRRVPFTAPLSGEVIRVNSALREDPRLLEDWSYGDHWICVLEGDDLDTELPRLKIGKSAAAFFQDEIDRFGKFLSNSDEDPPAGYKPLAAGVIASLDDTRWKQAVREFFGG